MSARSILGCFVMVGIAAALFGAAPAVAGAIEWDSYSAKFVCGAESGPAGQVVKGKYRTIINIHNPNYLLDVPEGGGAIPVQFFKKVVLALPQGQPPLPPSCHIEEFLESDWALGVDCENIKALLALSGLPTSGDLEGFLVLQVPPFQGLTAPEPPVLDVVGVYTARKRTGVDPDARLYDVETIDVQPVEPVPIRGQPNINLCGAY